MTGVGFHTFSNDVAYGRTCNARDSKYDIIITCSKKSNDECKNAKQDSPDGSSLCALFCRYGRRFMMLMVTGTFSAFRHGEVFYKVSIKIDPFQEPDRMGRIVNFDDA